jgi:thiamine biosynthesis lipoprotein
VKASHVHTAVFMDTVVTSRIVGRDDPAAAERAFDWFRRIEAVCGRFDPDSEVQLLSTCVNEPANVTDILFETTRFALALAEETDGAFDPTVGYRMERRGFDRDYRTGERIASAASCDEAVSYRDVHVDADARTLMLDKPLVLDLGAVAKGFAIDMAARELAPLEHFAIDAGGDLYLGGRNEYDRPWSVGIRHPRDVQRSIAWLEASNAAVCTSGDYLRHNEAGEHHIIDARTGASATQVVSATVSAPLAMMADALATAAFVLGPTDGLALLERHGVDGLLITPTLEQLRTRGT